MKKILIERLIQIVPRERLDGIRSSSSMRMMYYQICQKMEEDKNMDLEKLREKKREILLRLVDYRLFITWGYLDSLKYLRELTKEDLLDLLENPSYFKLINLKLDFILNIPGLIILENYGLPDQTLSIFPDLLINLDHRIERLIHENRNMKDKKSNKLKITTGNLVNGGKSIGAILEESMKMTQTSTQKKLLKQIFARFIQTQLDYNLLDFWIENFIIDQIHLPEIDRLSEIDIWNISSIYPKCFNCQKDISVMKDISEMKDGKEIKEKKETEELKYKLIYPKYFGLSKDFRLLISKIKLMIQGNQILNYISRKLLRIEKFESDFIQLILSNLSEDLINKLSLCQDLLQVLSISILKSDSAVYDHFKIKILNILRNHFFLQISNSLGKDRCQREIDILEKYFHVDQNYANCLLIRSLIKNNQEKGLSPPNQKLFSMSRFRQGLALRLVSYPEIKQKLINHSNRL